MAGGGEKSCEKALDCVEIVDQWRRRQRIDEAAAVSPGPETRIEHRENAAVATMADEPAQALLQHQDRQRDLILGERVAASSADRFDARGGNRIRRRRERQLVDDDAAERVAGDVHTLPAARGGEEHGGGLLAELPGEL